VFNDEEPVNECEGIEMLVIVKVIPVDKYAGEVPLATHRKNVALFLSKNNGNFGIIIFGQNLFKREINNLRKVA
jgi:hypothetical protein